METENQLKIYIDNIKKTADKRSLTIGWQRHNAFNPFSYNIFVKDSFGNLWDDNFCNSSVDLDGMFEVWKEIEKLLIKVIEQTK